MVTGLLILTAAMALGYALVCWVQDPFWSGDDDEGGEE
jgi:hypothetical protein